MMQISTIGSTRGYQYLGGTYLSYMPYIAVIWNLFPRVWPPSVFTSKVDPMYLLGKNIGSTCEVLRLVVKTYLHTFWSQVYVCFQWGSQSVGTFSLGGMFSKNAQAHKGTLIEGLPPRPLAKVTSHGLQP